MADALSMQTSNIHPKFMKNKRSLPKEVAKKWVCSCTPCTLSSIAPNVTGLSFKIECQIVIKDPLGLGTCLITYLEVGK